MHSDVLCEGDDEPDRDVSEDVLRKIGSARITAHARWRKGFNVARGMVAFMKAGRIIGKMSALSKESPRAEVEGKE